MEIIFRYLIDFYFALIVGTLITATETFTKVANKIRGSLQEAEEQLAQKQAKWEEIEKKIAENQQCRVILDVGMLRLMLFVNKEKKKKKERKNN